VVGNDGLGAIAGLKGERRTAFDVSCAAFGNQYFVFRILSRKTKTRDGGRVAATRLSTTTSSSWSLAPRR